MQRKAEKHSLSALSPEFVPWEVVNGKSRSKTQRTKVKDEVEFQVHLNHFFDVEPVPFDILVDVPAENCINCLGPRHYKCNEPQSHDYCFNCGRGGVRVNTCPRCRRAYPAYMERRKLTGLGREVKKATVKEAEKMPVEPVVNKVPPVITDIQAYPPPIVKETMSWTSAVKTSSLISDAQWINNDFVWHNENMMGGKKHYEITHNYLQDLTNLMGKIKNLNIIDQNRIVLEFISERQKLLEQ